MCKWPSSIFQEISAAVTCLCRRDVVSFRSFRFWKQVIYDIVLRSRISGEGGYRAEADRVIRGSQNLAQAVTGRTGILPVHEGKEAAERGAGESRKDSGAYAAAYCRSTENFAKVRQSEIRSCATWASPTWRVFSSCFVKGVWRCLQ